IQAQDNDRWKQVFDKVLRSSRYDLPEARVQLYLGYSFDYIVEYLRSGHESRARGLDPIGALNLRIAKKLRRAGKAEGGSQDPRILDELADRFFPLPTGPLLFWPKANVNRANHLLTSGDTSTSGDQK
ncbi:MAG: hypothetical protein HKO65_16665, partial [Gemmatimonadetes bacterium]|nr:hypothetical protein [Gemmatimonadota bacterium]